MPSSARKDTIPEGIDAFCHCTSRCVRRGFLCGLDSASGKDYSHRRAWVRQRLEELAGCLAIEVLSHAIMENHYHVVLHLRPDIVDSWSDDEVVRRWLVLSSKKIGLQPLDDKKVRAALKSKKRVAAFRKHLSSLSRFMWYLNEPIARMANKEDKVTGRFFEERFHADLILDDAGLLACNMYVDLNVVRAGMASTPEESAFASISDRIKDVQCEDLIGLTISSGFQGRENPHALSGWLNPVPLTGDGYDGAAAGRRVSNKGWFDFDLNHYLEILDWSGRQLRGDKRGQIPAHLGSILERLRIPTDGWLELIGTLGERFHRFIGHPDRMLEAAKQRGQRWCAGIKAARAVFG